MNRKNLLLCFLSLILLLSSYNVTSTGNYLDETGNFDYENELVHIKVTGNQNVPKYIIWSLDQPEITYQVFFNSIFTANDTNNDGIYQPESDNFINKNQGGFKAALPASSWEFTDVVTNPDGAVSFDIISTSLGNDKKNPNQSDNYRDARVILRNTISGSEATEIKFDVELDGFDFSDAPDTTILVFGYTLSSNETVASGVQDGYTVSFGEAAFFSSVPTATDANGNQVDVGLFTSSDVNGTSVYLSYPTFSGALDHDPTVGVQSNPTPPPETTEETADSDGDDSSSNEDTDGNDIAVSPSSTTTSPSQDEQTTQGPALGEANIPDDSGINTPQLPIAFGTFGFGLLSLGVVMAIVRRK